MLAQPTVLLNKVVILSHGASNAELLQLIRLWTTRTYLWNFAILLLYFQSTIENCILGELLTPELSLPLDAVTLSEKVLVETKVQHDAVFIKSILVKFEADCLIVWVRLLFPSNVALCPDLWPWISHKTKTFTLQDWRKEWRKPEDPLYQ